MESAEVRRVSNSGGRKRCVAHAAQEVANRDASQLLKCMARGISSERHAQRKRPFDVLPHATNPEVQSTICGPQSSSFAFSGSRGDGNAAAGNWSEDGQGEAVSILSGSESAVPHADLESVNVLKNLSFVKAVAGEDANSSAQTFYGSSDARDKPREFRRLMKRIRRTLENSPLAPPESSASAGLWVTFPRQDMAFQFADSHGGEEGKCLPVFVYQDHASGSRRFLVTTIDEFWRRYSTMPAIYRHHYEVIREGRPCHLYFDLEFDRTANPSAVGETMVTAFLSVLSEFLKEVYDVDYDDSWTVELDSSTPDKFSVHLIVHISGAAFKNNFHVGCFVKELSFRISERREEGSRCGLLFVRKRDDEPDKCTNLFLDPAVYTRNRSFRLPLSAKAGKTATLIPTQRFRCKDMDQKKVFLESLICLVDSSSCSNLLTFGEEMLSQPERSKPCTSPHAPSHVSGRSRSPFPAVDEFIESIASVGDVSGTVRSWMWLGDYGSLVFNIVGNRFCENIGRPHKSNNVMYTVNFRMAGYYQMCHDPDCKGYRSDMRPIPQHLVPPLFCHLSHESSPPLTPTPPHHNPHSSAAHDLIHSPHILNSQPITPTSTTHDYASHATPPATASHGYRSDMRPIPNHLVPPQFCQLSHDSSPPLTPTRPHHNPNTNASHDLIHSPYNLNSQPLTTTTTHDYYATHTTPPTTAPHHAQLNSGYHSDMRPIPHHLVPPQSCHLSHDSSSPLTPTPPHHNPDTTPFHDLIHSPHNLNSQPITTTTSATHDYATHTTPPTTEPHRAPLNSGVEEGEWEIDASVVAEDDAAFWDEAIQFADHVEAKANASKVNITSQITPPQSVDFDYSETLDDAWWSDVVAQCCH